MGFVLAKEKSELVSFLPLSSSDSKIADIDPIGGGSDIAEEEKEPAVAVGAEGGAKEKLESEDDSEKGSDNSAVKQKPLAMKHPWTHDYKNNMDNLSKRLLGGRRPHISPSPEVFE
ncbi:UNVERIFIED_CONTAM: hypothetical protein K2H54_012661 [Gekko kuhli]